MGEMNKDFDLLKSISDDKEAISQIDKFLDIFKLINDDDEKSIGKIDEAKNLYKILNDKETIAEIKRKLMNDDFSIDIKTEVIDKTVNIITTQIKQMKLKNELESITLEGEAFPATVTISCGGEIVKLESEFVKPKELHYEMDAISADYSFTYSNNPAIIMETYQEIITKLKNYNWNNICKVSKAFKVNYAI